VKVEKGRAAAEEEEDLGEEATTLARREAESATPVVSAIRAQTAMARFPLP
jgi:hypothetical protein